MYVYTYILMCHNNSPKFYGAKFTHTYLQTRYIDFTRYSTQYYVLCTGRYTEFHSENFQDFQYTQYTNLYTYSHTHCSYILTKYC